MNKEKIIFEGILQIAFFLMIFFILYKIFLPQEKQRPLTFGCGGLAISLLGTLLGIYINITLGCLIFISGWITIAFGLFIYLKSKTKNID